MSHGFYAIMGGFAITIPENIPESKRFLPSHRREDWFISTKGLELMLKQENFRSKIPNLSEDDIRTRSKAGGLAKSMVCIQALWFIAQCLTRCKTRSSRNIEHQLALIFL